MKKGYRAATEREKKNFLCERLALDFYIFRGWLFAWSELASASTHPRPFRISASPPDPTSLTTFSVDRVGRQTLKRGKNKRRECCCCCCSIIVDLLTSSASRRERNNCSQTHNISKTFGFKSEAYSLPLALSSFTVGGYVSPMY